MASFLCRLHVGTRLVAFRFLYIVPIALALVLASRIQAAEGDPITPEEISRGFRARTLLAKPRGALAAVERLEAVERVRLLRVHSQLGGLRALETDGAEDVQEVIKRLSASGLYDYVEPDHIRFATAMPNDPRFAADQWSLVNTGQAGGIAGADIKAQAAWEIQRDAADVIVAVMDTGVNIPHEDIFANIWQNQTEVGGRPGVDDDGNGYIDDLNGINATVAKSSSSATDALDSEGHGSHVAGIIGAIGDNGTGVAGIAWSVKIMPLKFIGRYGGSVSAAVACIDYAIAKGAHIINGSYGSVGFSKSEYDAIKRARDAGIIFVAAAGNDSQEITDFPEYPAAYRLDNIVAVASTTRQDTLANYSTFGSGLVELGAPGSSILSLGSASTSSYATLSGTSMAAPHVSGALALLKQKFAGENYRALINRLLSSVDPLTSLDHRVHTNGRLNLLRALASSDTRPFNDDFSRRATITGFSNIIRGSNQFATTEPGEPDHGVPGTTGTLWWSWTAPEGTGKATISTAASELDTMLAVYTGASLASLQRIAFNDDSDIDTTSSVTFAVTPGTTYAIAVGGKQSGAGLVTFEVSSVPMNDAFAAARLLSGPSVVVEANTARATSELDEPKLRTAAGRTIGSGRTLWFKWVAPQSRSYQISAAGKSTDPVIGVFTGVNLQSLTQVELDDDSGPSTDSFVRLAAVGGGTYYICVDSYSSTGSLTLSLADAAWQFVADNPFYATPALAADGTLYTADDSGLVHALNPDGTRKWRSMAIYSAFGYVVGGSLAVATDGTLYACDDFGVVYALNPTNGALKWSYETNNLIWAAPAIAPDGTLYIKSDDDQLYALNPDGTLKWKLAVPGDTYASPVVGSDGTIYIGSAKESALYAITAEGREKWRAALGASILASPALGTDGTIYIGNYDGRFFAIRPDGSERWHFDTGSPLSSSAVIDARGFVYFGSYNKKLYALDAATGTKRWDYTTGDTIRQTAPLIADDGTIYIGGDDRFVHALNPDGTLRRTYATTGPILSAPLISAGRLYVASTDCKLYAFDTGNNLARSPWPMHRHNVRRLGRANDLSGIPTFTTQPVAPSNVTPGTIATVGTTATLSGAGAISYQWLFNDATIPGATAAILTLPAVQGSNAGSYRVIATGPGGSLISDATQLTVAKATSTTSRLINLAVRTTAGSDDRVLFIGLGVGGADTEGTKAVLIRAVGPTLATFDVPGVLADPLMSVFQGQSQLSQNDDWTGGFNFVSVGAFAFAGANPRDAAIYNPAFASGSYSIQITGKNNGSGLALAEIYDATPEDAFTSATPRLINVSARTRVGTDGDILIAGFTIGGAGPKTIMVRAIGPSLAQFGVSGTLTNPQLELYAANNATPISTNDDWGAATNAVQVATVTAQVGAFALPLESRDAILLLTLQPGSYTAKVSGVNNATGSALVEVYEVP